MLFSYVIKPRKFKKKKNREKEGGLKKVMIGVTV